MAGPLMRDAVMEHHDGHVSTPAAGYAAEYGMNWSQTAKEDGQ
jgi:hypothetical protein